MKSKTKEREEIIRNILAPQSGIKPVHFFYEKDGIIRRGWTDDIVSREEVDAIDETKNYVFYFNVISPETDKETEE